MRFVGVDLAWRQHNHTGLCAVEGATVVQSGLARSDEQILDWLRPHSAGPCVVAIDAPLVVRNPTGRRPCERALDRCFRPYEAGCHPSNTRLVPPRAERLANTLGLSPDPFFPAGRGVRRAVEVYPHAALVALFHLDRTLKYKARRGRTVASRHAEFARLVALLESLVDAEPAVDVRSARRWQELVTSATTDPVGARLDRVEDELDAFVCAYVARYLWAHGRARTRVVGDLSTGYIATPVTPALARCLDSGAGPPPASLGAASFG